MRSVLQRWIILPYNPRNVEVRPNTRSGCIYKLGAMQNEFRRFEKWLRVDYNFEDSVITDLIESAKAIIIEWCT